MPGRKTRAAGGDGINQEKRAYNYKKVGPGRVCLQDDLTRAETIWLPKRKVAVDAREAELWWDTLDRMWRLDRPYFDALIAFVLGRATGMDEASVACAKPNGLLEADGSVKQAVKHVLLECCEQTPRGLVWHDLVEKIGPRDGMVVEMLRAKVDENAAKLFPHTMRIARGKDRDNERE